MDIYLNPSSQCKSRHTYGAFNSLAPTVAAEGHLLTEIIELNGIRVLSLN